MENKHGGARQNSGRLKKDDVISLVENMDKALIPQEVWEKLAGRIKEGDVNAIKLWLSYRFGLPKQTIEQTILTEQPLFPD